MKDIKQTLILAVLLCLCICLGITMRIVWRVNKMVSEVHTVFIQEGKELAKDAGTYLKEEYSDDLKRLSQEQIDSAESKLSKFWKK